MKMRSIGYFMYATTLLLSIQGGCRLTGEKGKVAILAVVPDTQSVEAMGTHARLER